MSDSGMNPHVPNGARPAGAVARLSEETAAKFGLQASDESEDYGAFGWLRGMRERAIMLELRKRDGNIVAICYSWIERIEFDPSVGITLYASGKTVSIRGRNLNAEVRPGVRLLSGLTSHRVPWIADSQTQLTATTHGLFVQGIEA